MIRVCPARNHAPRFRYLVERGCIVGIISRMGYRLVEWVPVGLVEGASIAHSRWWRHYRRSMRRSGFRDVNALFEALADDPLERAKLLGHSERPREPQEASKGATSTSRRPRHGQGTR